jgi:hypothetical protein
MKFSLTVDMDHFARKKPSKGNTGADDNNVTPITFPLTWLFPCAVYNCHFVFCVELKLI